MERGRTEWLRDLGVEQDWLVREYGLFFALTGTGARFNDRLSVRTRFARIGHASIALEQSVYRLNDGSSDEELLCSAACIDAQSFRPQRIPAGLLDARLTNDPRGR